MAAIKNGDFISLDYVGKLASTGKIFDLTDAGIAKKEGVFNPQQTYGPVIICVGQGQLVRGIDAFLEGKDVGKDYDVDIDSEQGFGRRIAKLIKLVNINKFKDQNTNPFPGARVMIDGMPATIRSISGGRVLVDFNHPLAGQKLHYWLKINKVVTDSKEQAKSILEKFIPADMFSLEIKDKDVKDKSKTNKSKKNKELKIRVKNKEQYKPVLEILKTDMQRLIKGIDNIKIE